MKCNVGIVDRIIRIFIGASIIGLGIIFNNWLGVIGIIPLLTGIIKFCPLYSLIKISTCKNTDVGKK